MKILIIIVVIVAIPFVIALFTRKDYTVEREIVINKPQQDVFNYIKVLKNQEHYSKWVMMDPNVKLVYSGTDGTVGSSSAWDSQEKNVGKGIQTISKLADGQRMDLDIHFIRPFEANSTAYMTTETVNGNQTKVKWGFNGSMKYPMNFMLLVMNMEKMLGDDLSTGLGSLKGVLEK